MIRLENISKTFRTKDHTVEAVKNVSIDIADGEIYGIIGFSGAGKSTLVRCLNLLERPTEGKVFFGDKELTSLSASELRQERRKIGMIFQQFNLMSSRNVEKNVALPLEGTGKTREEISARVKELLEYVGLSDKAKAYPSQLSGGQKQRVAIARALANEPSVLLCDEATSALDPQTTRSILNLLVKLNKELGITIIVITHEMAVIKKICNRVAVMEFGEVVEEGEVISVFARPQKQITKDFISTTSNLTEIYTLVEEDSPVARVNPGEVLVKINYLKASVSEPLISTISSKYDLVFNILFSDVEIIGGCPLGGTVGIVSGDSKSIDDAFDYLREKEISVEVIRDARAS